MHLPPRSRWLMYLPPILADNCVRLPCSPPHAGPTQGDHLVRAPRRYPTWPSGHRGLQPLCGNAPSLDRVPSTYIMPLLSSGVAGIRHRWELHLCGWLEGEDKQRGRWHDKVGDMDEEMVKDLIWAPPRSPPSRSSIRNMLCFHVRVGVRKRAQQFLSIRRSSPLNLGRATQYCMILFGIREQTP
jgi:hypothetical protein